jgi:hypothetical protein
MAYILLTLTFIYLFIYSFIHFKTPAIMELLVGLILIACIGLVFAWYWYIARRNARRAKFDEYAYKQPTGSCAGHWD